MGNFILTLSMKSEYRQILTFLLCIVIFVSNAEASKHILKEKKPFDDDEIDHGEVIRGERSEERINLSVPGTKWCGPGNTANGYDDLGSHADVDACCRDHDHCDNIPSGETKYNLTNNDHFTVLHCKCDKEFYKCLHNLNTNMSNRIGKLYFTLRNHCYRDDFPIVYCEEFDTALFIRRCVRYMLDESASSRYQWFDIPLYNGKPSTRTSEDFELDNLV